MKNTRTLQQLVTGILAACFIATSSQAGLIFTIDTFTPNELTISIPSGPALAGTVESRDFFLMDGSARNDNWILSTAFSFSGSGQLGGFGLNISGAEIFNNNVGGGDVARISFLNIPDSGDTAAPAITASFTGTNLFDPTQVNSLALTWGTANYGSAFPFGAVQSITAVPEPTSFILLSAASGVLFFFRRNLS